MAWRLAEAGAVRAAIAHYVLGRNSITARLGPVLLHPHQNEAVCRLREILANAGGALLADDTGLGKTHVALTLMQDAERAAIVAPAALRPMWTNACTVSQCSADFVSFESLSRGTRPRTRFDLVVIDEAHHARNYATRRYRELSALTRGAKVLLLSATPVHNGPRDVRALLRLFCGVRALSMSDEAVARHMVRRTTADVQVRIPAVNHHAPFTIPSDGRIATLIADLPPMVTATDEGGAGPLASLLLHRLWSSSDAALRAGVRRRLARCLAMDDALARGTAPSKLDLALWEFDGCSLQLAFPELLQSAQCDCEDARRSLGAHQRALESLLASLPRESSADRARADRIRDIRAAHSGRRVIVFSAFAESVRAMWRLLSRDAGVCMLTADGAEVAGGVLSRGDALARFAPSAHGRSEPALAERIELLLCTDLLSEGVNLQDASIVVHLDIPWTNARLQQRVGRAARLGSANDVVHVYSFAPNEMAERVLQLERRLRAKQRASASAASPAEIGEALRRELLRWRRDSPVQSGIVCAVRAPLRGALVVVRESERVKLLASVEGSPLVPDAALALEIALHAGGEETEVPMHRLDSLIAEWGAAGRASALLALPEAAVAASRRRMLNKVSRALREAPPHRRPLLENLAARAREAVLAPAGAGVETEMQALCNSASGAEEFLGAAASLLVLPGEMTAKGTEYLAAILLVSDQEAGASAAN